MKHTPFLCITLTTLVACYTWSMKTEPEPLPLLPDELLVIHILPQISNLKAHLQFARVLFLDKSIHNRHKQSILQAVSTTLQIARAKAIEADSLGEMLVHQIHDYNWTLPIKERKQKKLEAIKQTIARGANPNVWVGGSRYLHAPGQSWISPLGCALARKQTEIVGLLVKEGADINLRYPDGKNQLIYQARISTGIIEEMFELKPDLDFQDSEGNTALMHAVKRGSPWMVARLLEQGARLDLTNYAGFTALDMANQQDSTKKRKEIIRTLKAYQKRNEREQRSHAPCSVQ